MLVRDDAAREALYAKAPELRLRKALVLTVPEAKGLEWNDVFVINFWASGTAAAEWRVVAVAALDQWDGNSDGLVRAPLFCGCSSHFVLLCFDEKMFRRRPERRTPPSRCARCCARWRSIRGRTRGWWPSSSAPLVPPFLFIFNIPLPPQNSQGRCTWP